MSLATMQLRGSNAYVSRLVVANLTEQEMLDRLAERYPGERSTSYVAALREGIRAYSAANVFERQDQRFPLGPTDVPSDGGPRNAYRFYVIVTVFNSSPRTQFDASLQLTFDDIPTPEELYARVKDRVAQLYRGPGQALGRYKSLPAPVPSEPTVIAIERTA